MRRKQALTREPGRLRDALRSGVSRLGEELYALELELGERPLRQQLHRTRGDAPSPGLARDPVPDLSGASTAIRASLNANDPSVVQPKGAATVVVNFPKGTKFNYKVPPVCTNSQAPQIQQTDGNICKKALVGTGSATANVKPTLASDVNLTIKAYNGQNKLYFYLVPQPGVPSNPLVLTAVVKGNKLTTTVPKLEPVPGQNVVLTSFVLNTKAISKGGQAFLTAPKTCNGKWTTTTNFTYTDGSTQSVPSTQPCKK